MTNLDEALEEIELVDKLAKCGQLNPQKLYKTFRDSAIQRFEYTFDLTWKYTGEYLACQGYLLEIKTLKSIFRECLKAKLLDASEV